MGQNYNCKQIPGNLHENEIAKVFVYFAYSDLKHGKVHPAARDLTNDKINKITEHIANHEDCKNIYLDIIAHSLNSYINERNSASPDKWASYLANSLQAFPKEQRDGLLARVFDMIKSLNRSPEVLMVTKTHNSNGVFYGKYLPVTHVPRKGVLESIAEKGYIPCEFYREHCFTEAELKKFTSKLQDLAAKRLVKNQEPAKTENDGLPEGYKFVVSEPNFCMVSTPFSIPSDAHLHEEHVERECNRMLDELVAGK